MGRELTEDGLARVVAALPLLSYCYNNNRKRDCRVCDRKEVRVTAELLLQVQ